MLRPHTISRRHFSRTLTSLLPALGFTGFASSSKPGVPDTQGISHTAEAIHQEVVIKANRKRVYEALTDEGQFRKISGGMELAATSNWFPASASCKRGVRSGRQANTQSPASY